MPPSVIREAHRSVRDSLSEVNRHERTTCGGTGGAGLPGGSARWRRGRRLANRPRRAARSGFNRVRGRSCKARRIERASIRGWQKGKGWGWIWGKDDEVGALNALSNQSRAAALALATRGEVFDLGMTYSRRSYKWPAIARARSSRFAAPTASTGCRTPMRRPPTQNPDHVYWHSAALFISDNVATQIDGLAHITAGARLSLVQRVQGIGLGRRLGPAKCDASTIPPIVARGVLIDVAGVQEGRGPCRPHGDLTQGPARTHWRGKA